MIRLNDLRCQRERQFRRFRNLIIAGQVAIVVAIVWLLAHPETIGAFARRIFDGFAS